MSRKRTWAICNDSCAFARVAMKFARWGNQNSAVHPGRILVADYDTNSGSGAAKFAVACSCLILRGSQSHDTMLIGPELDP